MVYSMRFFAVDARRLSIDALNEGLKSIDFAFYVGYREADTPKVSQTEESEEFLEDLRDEESEDLDEIEDTPLEEEALYEEAQLWHGDTLLGSLEISREGDAVLEEELAEFREAVEEMPESRPVRQVLNVLRRARGLVSLQTADNDADADEVRQRLAPLWDWLFRNHDGILHVEGKGFYDAYDLVLETD